MNEDIYIEYIRKDLNGSLNEQERIQLEEWRASNDEHEVLYKQLFEAWKISGDYGSDLEINASEDYKKVKAKLKDRGRNSIVPFRWMGIAATGLILIASYFMIADSETRIFADTDGYIVVLPDDSKITLKKGSELKYDKDFEQRRKMEFSGSAMMEITHQPDQPLEIISPRMSTKVLGTTFLIDDRYSASASSVHLIEGKVRVVQRSTKELFLLEPNERAEVNDSTIQLSSGVQWEMFSWYDQPLSFQSSELDFVIQILESYFKSTIRLDEKMKSCIFSGNFNDQPLDEILESISLLYGASLSADDNVYMIRGEACK